MTKISRPLKGLNLDELEYFHYSEVEEKFYIGNELEQEKKSEKSKRLIIETLTNKLTTEKLNTSQFIYTTNLL